MSLKFLKNPFLGMNPWLVEFWGDIHTSLTNCARDAIQRQLPADLMARVEEYLAVDESTDGKNVRSRRISPDVPVLPSNAVPFMENSPVAVLTEQPTDQPIRVRRQAEPQTLRFIEIVDLRAGRRVITAIEFLSLTSTKAWFE